MNEYNPHDIEPRWQKVWAEEKLYEVTEDTSKPKRYVLEMFPYPSGDIHMGHVSNYTYGDVVARYWRMKGYEVLHPMGWDAFGLPAENAAIKHHSHPAKWTYANIDTQKVSFKRMGFSFDWNRTVVACDPDYYRWGQWIFLKFWERGLVERRNSPVNWCPDCATVLANEQVIEGRCWRCDSEVEKRDLTQWYYKITDYAQELLDDLLRREADMTLAPYAKPGEVMLQLSARGADERACEARMAPVLAEVRARLGAYFYGADVSGLEETVLTLCRERGLTLAAAESCTGGLIAKRLTDIPGASQVFLGGVVSYTNHVKQQVLHVPENLLARCGAVSAEVARAMALGVRVLTGADLAVSVTGLAGPDGDDRGNPVGTVFVGLSAPEGVTVRHLTLGGDRERIRTLSAHHAFDMLRRYLTNLPTEGE